MKWFGIVLSVLLVLLIALYTLLFTPFGNGILKPVLQERLNTSLNAEAVIETFALDMSSFEIKIALTPSNVIAASGTYSPFSQAVDAVYTIAFEKMNELETLLQRRSQGKIHISGTAKGDADVMKIAGESDIASSQTRYDVTLKSFNPAAVIATIDNARLDELLALAGEKAYADARVSLQTEIKGVDVNNFDGDISFLVKNGKVDRALMRRDFNITLPQTRFGVKVVAKLKGDAVDYSAVADSNLLTLNSGGNVIVQPMKMDLDYDLDIKELALLRPLTNAPLRGAFATKGNVKGDEAALNILGKSDIAGSDSRYDITLSHFKPSKVLATVKNAKLSKLLYLAGEEKYAEADVNLNVDLSDLDPQNLQGSAKLDVSSGTVFPKTMKKAYSIALPKTDFNTRFSADLKGKEIDYTLALLSNLAQINSKGSFEPGTMKSDIAYDLNIKELALFKPLTKAPLRGPFATAGQIRGDKEAMQIKGHSDIAASQTTYDIALKAMQPSKLQAQIKNARLEKLIFMAGEPAFANGELNVDIALDELDPDDLQGNVKATVSKASFSEKVLKNSYKIDLPKTAFSSDISAKLAGKDIAYTAAFVSDLAKIDSKGNIQPKTMAMDLDLKLAIAKLELLKPITNAPLRGPFSLSTTAKGDEKSLTVEGKAKIAGADAGFNARLESFAPRTLKAKIADMQLAKILYMTEQLHYADGLLNVDVNIDDARQGKLSGKILSSVTKGRVDTKTVEKAFEFTAMPKTTFTAKTVSVLSKNRIDTKIDVASNLAGLKVKRARFDVEKGSLHADYRAEIPDVDKLYFATQRHLKGAVTATGELSKAKDLDFSAHSKLFGGRIDAKLHNDDFHADMTKLNTLGVLKMLIYPEIFDSNLDGKLDYNLAKKSGTFHAKTRNGHFTKNQMLDLVKQYGKKDLYKENFVSTFNSRIREEHIYTDLDMRSNKSSITGKNVYLNSKTKQIKAKLDINANNNPLKVELKGSAERPKVTIDASKLIEKELKKEAGKKINKLLKGLF
ncbi:hypothetical protein [Sulfurimonas sp. HSL3-7]|uniref:hypothetical protein n=1 Tax=Sulfonitrofixus jiaomeiensis TaxID=3131938 RepID=UPI0031F7809F